MEFQSGVGFTRGGAWRSESDTSSVVEENHIDVFDAKKGLDLDLNMPPPFTNYLRGSQIISEARRQRTKKVLGSRRSDALHVDHCTYVGHSVPATIGILASIRRPDLFSKLIPSVPPKGIPNGIAEDKKGKKRAHVEESFFTWFSDSEHEGDIFEIHDEVADIIRRICGRIPSHTLAMILVTKTSLKWMMTTR